MLGIPCVTIFRVVKAPCINSLGHLWGGGVSHPGIRPEKFLLHVVLSEMCLSAGNPEFLGDLTCEVW